MKNEELIEQGKEVAKRKRNRPDLEKFGYELAEPGDNAKATMFILELDQFDRVDLADSKQVDKRIRDFMQLCVKYDTKPQVSGLADSLGVDRRRLWEIANDVGYDDMSNMSFMAWYHPISEEWEGFSGLPIKITHWMPLPPPPATTTQEGGRG